MKNSLCIFLTIFRFFWENQPALAKNCYSNLVGPAKTCSEVFYNDKHADIGVEELQLLQSKHFHCFKDSSPGEMRCKPHFSDKCLRATLKFEDGSESVFLGCDYKNNSICKKLMTEMNFSEQFGKKLNRKLSICQHCYEDLCNMKSGIRAVTQKFPSEDVLALIKRDADEKSTSNDAFYNETGPPTVPLQDIGGAAAKEAPVHDEGAAVVHSTTPARRAPSTTPATPFDAGAMGPAVNLHEPPTTFAEPVAEGELRCYESDADHHCEKYIYSIKAYNCMRSAKVVRKLGCAVCVTATVIAKDGDIFQLAMCADDPSGRQCKHMNSDWVAEAEHTIGKGIKEVKCQICNEDLCNKVMLKSQTTKHELPNLGILILAAIFLTLI